jgi:hypothetical protein
MVLLVEAIFISGLVVGIAGLNNLLFQFKDLFFCEI